MRGKYSYKLSTQWMAFFMDTWRPPEIIMIEEMEYKMIIIYEYG